MPCSVKRLITDTHYMPLSATFSASVCLWQAFPECSTSMNEDQAALYTCAIRKCNLHAWADEEPL